MANKLNQYTLELIVPTIYKNRVNKLVLDTRTSRVKNENILLNDMSQQDSIVYTWIFNNMNQRDSTHQQITERLNQDYFTNYHMVVT